jgi:hypothetical protein
MTRYRTPEDRTQVYVLGGAAAVLIIVGILLVVVFL